MGWQTNEEKKEHLVFSLYDCHYYVHRWQNLQEHEKRYEEWNYQTEKEQQ